MLKTVLLADASVTTQRVVELTFAREDVRVLSVANGDQAIDAITRAVPDMVLADIGMPGRSGFDLAQFVRSQPATASVPVLLLAGAFDAVDPALAHEAGADGIITKPFDPVVLVSRVMELLTEGRGMPSVVQIHPPSPSAAFRSSRAITTRPTLEPVDDFAADAPPTDAPPPAADGLEAAAPPAPERLVPPQPEVAAPVAAPRASAEPRPAGADYFDQIDQAFAALSKNPRPPAPAPALVPIAVTADEDDLLPLDDEAMPAGAASAPAPHAVPLTDAFTALLDAERAGQPDPALRVAVAPPAARAAAPIAATAIDLDALADQIASRVLAQLSDRVVRETVADITSATAERLVREEIERIKRNIK